MSAIPQKLRASLAALALLAGAGGSLYIAEEAKQEAQSNAYIQAVAADQATSDAVKIAMVMANYYESSNRHIGKPYIDKLGKGQPLTVCNGITGAVAKIDPNHYYTPAECYAMEKQLYIAYEQAASKLLTHWASYGPFAQATFADFLHNKGEGNFRSSTMRRMANAGDLAGACKQNERWNRGTVRAVSVVLPGLDSRAKSNAELCMQEGGL